MGLPPGPHPRHVVAAAEVLGVLRLLPPRLLAGGLAHLAAGRLDAVALPAAIARVGHEELSAMQALARSARMHRPASKLRLRRSTHLRSRGPGTGIRGEEKPRKEEDSSLSNEGRRSTQEEVTSCPPETEHFMPAAYKRNEARGNISSRKRTKSSRKSPVPPLMSQAAPTEQPFPFLSLFHDARRAESQKITHASVIPVMVRFSWEDIQRD